MQTVFDINDFIQSSIDDISFYRDIKNQEVIIFHKKQDSLLKFSINNEVTNDRISNAIDQVLKHLNWDQDFQQIFNKQEYRKALMNIPNILIG